jgi:hypothetical protein
MLSHLKRFEPSDCTNGKEAYRVSNLERLMKPDEDELYKAFLGDITFSDRSLLIVHDGGGEWSAPAPPIYMNKFDRKKYEERYHINTTKQENWLRKFLKGQKEQKETQDSSQLPFPRVLVNVKTLPELLPSEGKEREFRSSFWRTLSEFKPHVGIVIAMSTLRRFGAAISLGLSWEQTIEDFAAELYLFPELKALSRFRHLFVRVGLVGLIHIENDGCAGCPFSGRVYFMPYTLEGIERDPESEGRVIGKNTLLLASLAFQQGRNNRPHQGKTGEGHVCRHPQCRWGFYDVS